MPRCIYSTLRGYGLVKASLSPEYRSPVCFVSNFWIFNLSCWCHLHIHHGRNVYGTSRVLFCYGPCSICYRHFTWAWHTVIMGTGATSALVHAFPYGHQSLTIKIVTLTIFFLNIIIFVLFTGAAIARYTMFPDIWVKMIHHPTQSLFIGSLPMGTMTLINIALVNLLSCVCNHL